MEQRRREWRLEAPFYGVTIYLSTALSAAMLVGSGLVLDLERWYLPHMTLRHQTESLIDGRLGLSRSPADVNFDDVWDNGRVQQVWGLGVPAWRAGFDGLSRLASQPDPGPEGEQQRTAFPDRIAFGVAFSVVLFLVLLAFTSDPEKRTVGSWVDGIREHCERFGAVVILAAFPPFLALLHAVRVGVYEEVQAYSLLVGIGLLSGTVLSARNPRYLLDFAPGFVAGSLAFLYILRDWGVPRFGRRFRWFLLAGLLLWWGYQVMFVSEFGRKHSF